MREVTDKVTGIKWHIDDTIPDCIAYAYDYKIIQEYLNEKKKKIKKAKE